jgi:cobalt-zinc-cadmium efflux system outer membrane protein
LTLELALQTAFRQNPQLRIAELEVEANKGAVQQAGIIPNPSLGFEQQDTGRATRQTTFQLSQPIELGGKRSARMELANSGQEVAMAELAMRRAELRAVTTQAFFEALIAQERVRVAEESLKIVASGTAATARRVTAGKISPTEETRARVAEANVRIELRQAQADRLAALRSLVLVMGSPANSIDQLDGRPETLPIPQGNEAINDRLMKSPVLRRAQGEVRRAQAAYELERARRIPDVTVSLGAVRSQDFGRDQPIIGLSIPLPLFDRNQGAQLQALRRLDAAQVQAEAEEVRLRSEVLQAADQLQARTSEVQALQQEVLPGAQSAYEAASRGFELGKFGFLDVLDAQRTWLLARTQYLNALGEAHRASAELERRLGSANDRPEVGNQP